MPSIVQVTLRTADNISANYVTNQFCISGVLDVEADMDLVRDAFADFYDGIRPDVYPSSIAANGHIVKLYDAEGLAPNYPYYESTFDFSTAPTGDTLPSEVAICLSFQGARTAGLPQSRRRGRVYIGPLVMAANNNGRPGNAVTTELLVQAPALAAALSAITGPTEWCVWSPTTGTAVPLIEAWVDNAFDTQRSRGVERTSRTFADLV